MPRCRLHLSRDRKVLRGILRAIIPAGGNRIAFGADEVGLDETFLEYILKLGKPALWAFRGLLILFEYGPFLFGPSRRAFTRLTPKQQEAYLQGFEESRFFWRRQMIFPIKFLASMHFYGHPRVEEALGYGPAWRDESSP